MASKRVSENKLVVSTGAAQTSSVRKPSASRRTARSAKPVETPETHAAEPEAATPVAVAPVVDQPSQEAIAALAHSLWLARGCADGSPEEDWLRAEQELRAGSAVA